MKNFITLLLFPLLFLLSGCAGIYAGAPVEAWVIDADTKKPVEGVIVVANWQLRVSGLDGSRPRGQLMIMETITDKEGRFQFPAWGPKLGAVGHYLGPDSPGLVFFKPGYLPDQRSNGASVNAAEPFISTSRWSGATITLVPHRNDWQTYFQRQASLKTTLGFATIDAQDCEWRQLPNLLAALTSEGTRLASEGHKEAWRIAGVDSIREDKRCGSVREFFAAYLK